MSNLDHAIFMLVLLYNSRLTLTVSLKRLGTYKMRPA